MRMFNVLIFTLFKSWVIVATHTQYKYTIYYDRLYKNKTAQYRCKQIIK